MKTKQLKYNKQKIHIVSNVVCSAWFIIYSINVLFTEGNLEILYFVARSSKGTEARD